MFILSKYANALEFFAAKVRANEEARETIYDLVAQEKDVPAKVIADYYRTQTEMFDAEEKVKKAKEGYYFDMDLMMRVLSTKE